MPLSVLDVSLHGDSIGVLTRLPDDSTLFSFHENYVEHPSRPTLSLSFKQPSGELKLPKTTPTRGGKLPAFFSNLLPEGHMRTYLAQQAGVHPEREFYLLEQLGQDLPGALTITPMLQQLAMLEAPSNEETSESNDGLFHFSLAGVQLKFSAVEAPQGGLTIPTRGIGGHWIVKLPSQRWAGVPENEYSMMVLAKAVGIPVPEMNLIPTHTVTGLPSELSHPGNASNSLAVKRFDRGENQTTIHMEDLAQVFGLYPHEKYKKVSYDNIARLLWLQAEELSVTLFIRLLVFNLAIGNGDAHLKNFSLLYPDTIHPILSPAYDLVATLPYMPEPTLALSLGGTKHMHEIGMSHFEALAKKAGISTNLVRQTVEEAVQQFQQAWATHHSNLPMTEQVRQVIETHFSKVPLFAKNVV